MEDDSELKAPFKARAAMVLKGEYVCHECGCIVPVFAPLLIGPFQGDSLLPLNPDEDSAMLRRPQVVPPELAAVLTKASHGNYRPDFSKTVAETYWMNHCQECDAKIGDWFVHKPGEAFFPTTDEEQSKLSGKLVEGPFTFIDPDIAVSSWTSRWMQDPKRF